MTTTFTYFTTTNPVTGEVKTRKSREDYGYTHAVWTIWNGKWNASFTASETRARATCAQSGGHLATVTKSDKKPKK